MPALEAFFVRDTARDIIAALGPYKLDQPISRAKVGTVAAPVLMDTRGNIRGDTDIHRTAVAIGHDVYPAALTFAIHADGWKKRDPGSSPG